MIIAIDGPAGSGKSTIAHLVSVSIHACDLDTGAMYRSVTYRALEQGLVGKGHGLADEDSARIAQIAAEEPIGFSYDDAGGIVSVTIGGRDVTGAIRESEVDQNVAIVSAIPAVRAALTEQQRRLARIKTTVLEGRDIGTVVFPDAELKVFLTARPEVRAHRRALQNAQSGRGMSDEKAILEDIMTRDERDSSRALAPLAAAPDAVVIDTSDLTIDEVVAQIVGLVSERSVK